MTQPQVTPNEDRRLLTPKQVAMKLGDVSTEYCRHENCKREIRNCACNGDGTCGFNGVIHAKGNSHYCLPSPNCQVAEPADPPPMPHDKEYAEFADELRNYNFEPSLEVDKDQIRKLKAGTQMEERKSKGTAYCWLHGQPASCPKCESANREPQACRLCENPKEYELHTCNPKLLDDSYQEFDDYHKFQDTAIPSRLPFEAIKVCVTFLLQRFVKRQCDSEASSDCERCSVVAIARWFLDAERELQELRHKLELAIAHDRQPYPTAEAYEKVCAARTKWQAEAALLRGLVGRMLDWMKSRAIRPSPIFGGQVYCTICEAESMENLSIHHAPTCLISEAEAAIKEPHK